MNTLLAQLTNDPPVTGDGEWSTTLVKTAFVVVAGLVLVGVIVLLKRRKPKA